MLPKTQHDLNSFIVNIWFQSESILFIPQVGPERRRWVVGVDQSCQTCGRLSNCTPPFQESLFFFRVHGVFKEGKCVESPPQMPYCYFPLAGLPLRTLSTSQVPSILLLSYVCSHSSLSSNQSGLTCVHVCQPHTAGALGTQVWGLMSVIPDLDCGNMGPLSNQMQLIIFASWVAAKKKMNQMNL